MMSFCVKFALKVFVGVVIHIFLVRQGDHYHSLHPELGKSALKG